jgi:LacI family transcriptional regulator
VSVAVRTTLDDPLRELELLTMLRGERHRAVVIATRRSTDEHREQGLGAQLRTLARDGTRMSSIGREPSIRSAVIEIAASTLAT